MYRHVALAIALLVVTAGCLGVSAPAGDGPADDTTTAPPDDRATDRPDHTDDGDDSDGADDTPDGPVGPVDDDEPTTSAGDGYSAVAVDEPALDARIVDGGLWNAPGNTTTRRYVTLLDDPGDLEAVNMTRLRALAPEAATLVEGTDFGNASIVVFQEAPHSSYPDYRVENVTTTADGTLYVDVNDSSMAETADITVETLFVRVPNLEDGPDRVVVRTEDGERTTWSG